MEAEAERRIRVRGSLWLSNAQTPSLIAGRAGVFDRSVHHWSKNHEKKLKNRTHHRQWPVRVEAASCQKDFSRDSKVVSCSTLILPLLRPAPERTRELVLYEDPSKVFVFPNICPSPRYYTIKVSWRRGQQISKNYNYFDLHLKFSQQWKLFSKKNLQKNRKGGRQTPRFVITYLFFLFLKCSLGDIIHCYLNSVKGIRHLEYFYFLSLDLPYNFFYVYYLY